MAGAAAGAGRGFKLDDDDADGTADETLARQPGGDVEQRGATIGPSAEGLSGGILDTERVLVTTMMVYIVD